MDYRRPINAESLDMIAEFGNEERGEISRNLSNAIRPLKKGESDFQEDMLSEGDQHLIKLSQFLLSHRTNASSAPLIIDDAIGLLDTHTTQLIFKLLHEINKSNQIIIFTRDKNILSYGRKNLDSEIHLENELIKARQISAVSSQSNFLYDLLGYSELFTHHRTRRFVLDEPINIEEDRKYEIKEIKGNNPIRSIKSLADQYVVAFLNTEDRESGSIFWGIRNDDRVVVGVSVNQMQRDEIKRVVSEKLHQIQPTILPTAYKIQFHKVYKENKPVHQLYVIEINVPIVSSEYLYSTSKGEVYIKTDSGKKKLTPLEIQLEILIRRKIDTEE